MKVEFYKKNIEEFVAKLAHSKYYCKRKHYIQIVDKKKCMTFFIIICCYEATCMQIINKKGIISL